MSSIRNFSFVAAFALLVSFSFAAEDREVTVKKVSGDCVLITGADEKLVLAGLQFPEVPVRERLARKDRGIVTDDSVAFVRSALEGRAVRVVPAEGEGLGAVLVYRLPGGECFNTETVAAGRATADRTSELGLSDEFARAQEKAMLEGAGIWAESANGKPRMGVSSINNQARTVDFVSRYQGPAEEK